MMQLKPVGHLLCYILVVAVFLFWCHCYHAICHVQRKVWANHIRYFQS